MALETAEAILMVLESIFPSPGGGGAESQVRTLALEFLSRGHRLEVVVPMVAGGSQRKHDQVDGIPVTRIPYPKVPWIGAVWMLASLVWLLVARRRHYRVIHAHIAGNMAAVSSVVGRLLGKPVLVKLTGMTEMKGGVLDAQPRPVTRMRAQALKSAGGYQATSCRIGRMLVERGYAPPKVHHIPNAVNLTRFASVARDHALRNALCGDAERVGIFVGRLEPEKGLELMVQGWARVFAGRRGAALLLVGDGSLREGLQASARERGVEGQLVFVGPTAQVERYLALADFGVLTSQYEGLSNSLLEYMAAGLPVLGSEVSGTEDWVQVGRTGWLFPPGDLDGFVRALGRVAATPLHELRRQGSDAFAQVEQRASIPAVVDTLQTLYRQLEEERV